VRLRGGTPEKAAANVRYMNGERGYAARYWEVGNEPDLYLQRGGEPAFSPTWYTEQFRVYAAAMKAADSQAQVVGPVLSNKLDEWMRPFITACGDIVDGLSWHFYGGNSRKSEADLLASTADFDRQVALVRGWWSDRAINPLGHSRRVPLLITEYGASYETNSSRNLTTLPAALWTADMFGRLIANQIELAAYFALWGLGFHGVWDRRGTVRPVYHTFRMLSELGSRVVRAESSQPLLAVYAALRDDGALSLVAINKSPTDHYSAALEIGSFQTSGAPQLLRQAADLEGVSVPYDGTSGPITLDLPPYSTTVAIIPGQAGLPGALLWGGIAGLAGLAAAGAAGAYIRRRRRLHRS
jgi:hypothetical protein